MLGLVSIWNLFLMNLRVRYTYCRLPFPQIRIDLKLSISAVLCSKMQRSIRRELFSNL